MKAKIMKIARHRMGIDGKGVSTLVAFWGCPLHCRYCINDFCHDSETSCEELSPEELVSRILVDELYFRMSGGGIVFGGGEPLLNFPFIIEVSKLLPRDIPIRIETSFNVPWRNYFYRLLNRIDDWIIDIKDLDPNIYHRYTGTNNTNVILNCEKLAAAYRRQRTDPKKHILFRVPLIPDFNTQRHVDQNVHKLNQMGRIERFEYVRTSTQERSVYPEERSMGKRLIVAEKPSVGRDIANVLNCKQNGEGCRIGEHDIVTWAVGHLVGLCYPDEMDEKYTDWKLEDLPIFPEPFQLKVLESSKKQFEIVQKLMNDPDIDRIVCATDAGREGELIFRYIYQMVGCEKPVDRLWISSLTYRAIKEGLENLKPDSEYDNLYQSARCRSEADWLIGMNGSRAYAIVNDMRRLSVGRVLSPTLAILVRRELERRNFVPEEYCEVVASFEGFEAKMINQSKDGTTERSHFPMNEKNNLEDFARHHSSSGKVAFIDEFEQKEPPQQLYDLTSLQRDANRIYSMSSKWTLDTAQSLYEKHKAITYPRTDSRYLSTDIKATLQKRLESFDNGELRPFAKLALALMGQRNLGGRFILNKGVSDHHAIIPTGEAKGMETWTKQEKQIFDLISRRFIAMFYPDRDVIQQTVDIKVDDRIFYAYGEKEVNTGWRMVDTSKGSTVKALPKLDLDSEVSVKGMRVRTDETKPPAPHTEASLLAAMEHAGKIVPEDSDESITDSEEKEFGIGTPATRAATIEKMLDKEMAVRKGRALIPTEYGIKLISILPESLQSPEMTGVWEAKLEHISKGTGSPDEFMDGIRALTKEVVGYAEAGGDTGIKYYRYVGKCPLCGNPVREYETAYYCINDACDFRKIYKVVKGFHPTLDSATMRELLENKVAETKKGIFRLINEAPYISFERAAGPVPDYEKLKELINEYGVEIVDKVPAGGGMWFAGNRHDELAKDFIRDCENCGCLFSYHEDSKALLHQSGWCHKVENGYKAAYENAFGKIPDPGPVIPRPDVMNLIRQSGFEYFDKREKGGCIWFIAGEEEGKALAEKCRELGTWFSFAPNGGRATKKRPAWYSN